MKKISSTFLAVVMATLALSSASYAQSENVELTVTEAGLQTSFSEGDGNTAVLCFYDNDKLVYSSAASFENGQYVFNADEKFYDCRARISYMGGEVYDAVISEDTTPSVTETPSATPVPSTTPAPSATESPQATTTPSPTKTPYPEVYPREIDAVNAPMVVTDNAATMVDGEVYYNISVLYQGREAVISLKDSVEIKSAPDDSEQLIGMNAESLKPGDVIHMTAYPSGGIRSIEFIYRPEKTDYINNEDDGGNDFMALYSDNGRVAGSWNAMNYNNQTAEGDGYIFGVPVKTAKGYMVLANKEGEVKEILLDDGTIVYTVNNASRENKTENTGTGFSAIQTTFVTNDDFYESPVDWTDVDDITYALVRIIDGVATDIVVFTN